jgi:hypothetical protein
LIIVPIVCRVLHTGGKFAAGVVDTGGNSPLTSLTPVANLPPVANCHRYQQHQPQICHMGTILGYRHLELNLKAKIYIYGNSSTQRCPNKIIKIFLIEDFFRLPPVSTAPVVHV